MSDANIDTNDVENVDSKINNIADEVVKDAGKPSTNDPAPESEASKPVTKKLSLKERLALAAQKNKKDAEAAKKAKSTKSSEKNEVLSSKPEEKTTKADETSNEMDVFNDLLADRDDSSRSELITKIKSFVQQKLDEVDKVNKLKLSKLEKELKSRNDKKLTAVSSNTETELLNKLSEKETQIQALIDEGTKLSKKELLFNQTIKKLKAHETELEEDNESYEKTIEELNQKVVALETKSSQSDQNERLLTEEKLAYESLRKKYDSLVQANDSLTDELKEIKFRNLDAQLETTNLELTEEREEHEALKDEFEKLEISFDKLKEENSYTISELKKTIKKNESLIAERDTEIKRLEEKVESLRSENEIAIASSMKNSNIDILQQQYDEARENWNSIENFYSQKISNLEQQNEELQNANITYSKKLKSLTNDLKQKSSDIEELQESFENISSQLNTFKTDNNSLLNVKKELEDKIMKLQESLDNERNSLSKQIQKLEDDKISLETTLKLRNDEIMNSQPQGPNSFYMQDVSSSSSLNYTKPALSLGRSISSQNRKFSIPFGESSTTPRQSASNSAFSLNRLNSIIPMSPHDKILRHQNSILSLDPNETPLGINIGGTRHDSSTNISDNLTEIDEGEFTFNSPNMGYSNASPYVDNIPMGMDAEGDNMNTLNGDTPVIGSSNNIGSNIQLVKRLGAHVRMLELEMSTLKDETISLEREKESATNEIAKLLEENSKVEEIKKLVKEKEQYLIETNKNYDNVLVLLGEKEERVEELSADVDDLKDLLRQQVQQMVEMQEKINNLSKN